jgi:hypothetical protein
MSTNASTPAPGSSGVCRASSASRSRLTLPSWSTLPQVNDRRNGPTVDGARSPANTMLIAPWRSTSRSSIESAPAAIPAIRHPIFASAFAPHGPPMLTCRRARREGRPARPATPPGPARPATQDSADHATIALVRCPLEPGTGSFVTPIVPAQRAPFISPRASCAYEPMDRV